MHWSSGIVLVVLLAAASVPSTYAADAATTTSVDLGPLNFLKPFLINLLGQDFLQKVQTNVASLIQAVGSGDNNKIMTTVLGMVDPGNNVLNTLNAFNNYQVQMWTPAFRQNLAGILTGGSKAFSAGIECFAKNIQADLANFTSAYVAALEKSFADNTPNETTAAAGIAGVPQAAYSSLRLLIDMLTAPQLREAVVNGFRGIFNGYSVAYQCANANTGDLTKSWNDLTALLAAGSSGTGGAKTSGPTTAPSSGWFGLF